MQVRPLGREDPLEKGMATHSSVLAWRFPWTEKPVRLQDPQNCTELDTTESTACMHTNNYDKLDCSDCLSGNFEVMLVLFIMSDFWTLISLLLQILLNIMTISSIKDPRRKVFLYTIL